MSRIPYQFETPVPTYFRKNGWLKPRKDGGHFKMIVFLNWCFSRCSTEKRRVFHDHKELELEPFEFIFGRRTCSEETGLTEMEVRTIINQLISHPNGQILEKSTNSVTNRFTCYKWVTSRFSENNNQQNNQPPTNRQPTDNHNLEERSKKKEHIITDDLAVVEKDKDLSLGLDNSLKTKGNSQIIKAQDLNSSEITSDNICYVLDYQELTQKSNDKSQAENSQAKKAKVKIKPSDEVLLIFEFFKQSLDTHFKEIKTVPSLVDAKHFNSLVEKYDPEKIKEVISFAHTHHFWSSLTLTPSKFNKNFDSLLVQQKKGPSPPGQSRAVLGGKLQTEYNNLF